MKRASAHYKVVAETERRNNIMGIHPVPGQSHTMLGLQRARLDKSVTLYDSRLYHHPICQSVTLHRVYVRVRACVRAHAHVCVCVCACARVYVSVGTCMYTALLGLGQATLIYNSLFLPLPSRLL